MGAGFPLPFALAAASFELRSKTIEKRSELIRAFALDFDVPAEVPAFPAAGLAVDVDGTGRVPEISFLAAFVGTGVFAGTDAAFLPGEVLLGFSSLDVALLFSWIGLLALCLLVLSCSRFVLVLSLTLSFMT